VGGYTLREGIEEIIEGRKEGRCLFTDIVRLGLVEAAPFTSGTAVIAMTVIVVVV
jgi:hypothetical protein